MKLNIVSAIAGIIGVLLMCMVAHGASGFFVCKIVGGMPSGVAESGYTAFSYAGVGGPWQCTVSRTGDGCMITGSQVVEDGNTCSATVTLRNGWKATWGGTCPAGSESGGIYTTGNLSADCTLTAACTEQNILP